MIDIEKEVARRKLRGSIPPVLCRNPGSGINDWQRVDDRLYEEWATDSEYRARCFDRLADNPGIDGFHYPLLEECKWPQLAKEYRHKADLARQGLSAYGIAVACGEWPAGVRSRTWDPKTGKTTEERRR